MTTPKIVADHKGTATRDDDVFYLLDGSNNTKLVRTESVEVNFPNTGSSYEEFKPEKYVPYRIRYKKRVNDYISSNYTIIVEDYWEITDDKGIVYTYGGIENTRENVIAWGNWIGDSKEPNDASKHTSSWNLSKIQDQWGNNLTFEYDKIEQGINATGPKHTEASYLKQINSSSGTKIVFEYDAKTSSEYYEPHQEAAEPDAYQENYEKKYLKSVQTFNTVDNLVYTYELGYDVINKSSSSNKNRYFKSITQKSSDNTTLPPQMFEYYTTGTFEGGLKTIIYPTGGSITYNYDQKTIFDSTNPSTTIEGNNTAGYVMLGSFSGDNYALKFMSLGDIDHTGRENYGFKVLNKYWVGEKWTQSEFIFPEGIWVNRNENGQTYSTSVDNMRFVSGKDFYAFLIFNRTIDKGSVYLFHKEENGLDWKLTEHRNLPIKSGSINFPNEDPVLISGEDFVTVGENLGGGLFTFTWNGADWEYQLIQQEIGQFYYGATNNFIISLNEKNVNSGGDMITGVTTHPDNYYIHYLDAEHSWKTKSWSAPIDQNFTYVVGTNEPSYLYPSNSMVGFMADNNPEYIIRWDSNYNVIAVDEVFGSFDDTYPLLPVGNNNFSLYKPDIYSLSPARYEKTASFNGSNWTTYTFSNNFGQAGGINNLSMGKLGTTSNTFEWYKYDPNTHSWSYTPISSYASSGVSVFRESFSTTQDLALLGLNTYSITSNNSLVPLEQVLSGVNYASVVNTSISNGEQIFVEYKPDYFNIGSNSYTHSFLLDINKKNNSLNKQLITSGNIDSSIILNTGNSSVKQFGGTLPIISINTLNVGTFQRIIDGEINKVVKDIVVSKIEMDDNKSSVRKIEYTYNNAHTLPDDESTFYAEVIIENKGFGTGDNGKIIKYFNTGEDDVRMAGLPIKTIVEDKNGVVKNETEIDWDDYQLVYTTPSLNSVGKGYYLKIGKQIERIKLNGQFVITETNFEYNNKGYINSVSKLNSQGETETIVTKYAYTEYAFVEDKNMLTFPYEMKKTIGGTTVSIDRSLWKSEIGKSYIYESQSGVDENTIRTNEVITKVDIYGNVLESNNGKGVYQTILYGINNLYPVATITNARFDDVVNELSLTYEQLQNLSNSYTNELESELRGLYSKLPDAIITINIYDDRGKISSSIDERDEKIRYTYDYFGRLDYILSMNNSVIEHRIYNYGSD